MKKFTVSVVIPNFNGEHLLDKNLPFLLKAEENPDNNIIEVIVVDDGSVDGSVKVISSKFPTIKLIKHKINRGFSAAVNTGVRASSGDLILLLNTDVIPKENFLISVFKHFEDRKVFAVSLHEKGFGWARGIFSDGYIQLAMGDEGSEPHPSFYVSGGSGVFRREYWMELTGMDEKLFSPFYWEDIDLCYRAAKRGYINLWEPNGMVIHNHESTVSKFSKLYVQRIRERNQLLFIWKDLTSANLFRKHLAGLVKRLAIHPGYVRIVLMALRKLGVVIKERSREVKEAKVSDEVIFSRF
jgi:GT2 family glycosyltransferase